MGEGVYGVMARVDDVFVESILYVGRIVVRAEEAECVGFIFGEEELRGRGAGRWGDVEYESIECFVLGKEG